jgi:hypothetical protein
MVPVTVIPPSLLRRATTRPPLPPTTRTELVTGIAVLGGSSATTGCPFSARATIHTTFSLSDNADTGAA